jgi:hypothetical protein
MLLEAAMDTAQTLRLLRLGAAADLPFHEALGVIEAAIDQLDYAISAVLDAKEAA